MSENYLQKLFIDEVKSALTNKECGVIGANLIKYYNGEISNVILSKDVTSILPYAFNGHIGLKSITGLDNVQKVQRYAFYGCTKLESIDLPVVDVLETKCFYNCASLKSFTFHRKPKSIDSYAFDKCDNLIVMTCPWNKGEVDNAPWGLSNVSITYADGTVVYEDSKEVTDG